jgi:hypothetical protein
MNREHTPQNFDFRHLFGGASASLETAPKLPSPGNPSAGLWDAAATPALQLHSSSGAITCSCATPSSLVGVPASIPTEAGVV